MVNWSFFKWKLKEALVTWNLGIIVVFWSFELVTMENDMVWDISESPRYKFKMHTYVSMEDDPLGEFFQVLYNALHVEEIWPYIHWKFEIIGDSEIN